MNSQVYTATSGLILEQRRLDLIANNLANASSAGYRPQRLFSTTYRRFIESGPEQVRAANAAVAPAGAYDQPGRGSLSPTGRGLDVALEDATFLALDTPAGRRYARGGSLHVSPKGVLTHATGHPLIDGKGKPIKGLDTRASIGADGAVLVDGKSVSRVQVFRDTAGVLRREGDALFVAPAGEQTLQAVKQPSLAPGWIEASAVKPLTELVRLIEAQRAFESYQKLISLTMNEVNRRAVNDLAG